MLNFDLVLPLLSYANRRPCCAHLSRHFCPLELSRQYHTGSQAANFHKFSLFHQSPLPRTRPHSLVYCCHAPTGLSTSQRFVLCHLDRISFLCPITRGSQLFQKFRNLLRPTQHNISSCASAITLKSVWKKTQQQDFLVDVPAL